MEVQRLRTRGLEILKIANNVNPNYMKNVFPPKTDARVRPDDILAKSHKPTNYGDNLLLRNIKPETCFGKFNDSHREKLFCSIQYKNGCLAASDHLITCLHNQLCSIYSIIAY